MTMLPRLDAERELSAMQSRLATAVMGIEPDDARRWADAVRRVAEGDVERPRVAASPDQLAAIGISVVEA